MRIGRPRRARSLERLVERSSDIASILLQARNRGPVRSSVRRYSVRARIDSKGKQQVQVRLARLKAESRSEQAGVHRLQMAHVKDQPIAQRNWPLIKRIDGERLEKAVRARTSLVQ